VGQLLALSGFSAIRRLSLLRKSRKSTVPQYHRIVKAFAAGCLLCSP